jgi:3-oxoacyl-[acyl-carrier-protein] synthase II
LIPGSQAAFLVLEAGDRAESRGARPLAVISHLDVANGRSPDGFLGAELDLFLRGLPNPRRGQPILASLAGRFPAAARVRARFAEAHVHAVPDAVGDGLEAALPMQLALAALLAGDTPGAGAMALAVHPHGAAAAYLEAAA